MATSKDVVDKCAELSQQIKHQTELMRRLAAASARPAPAAQAPPQATRQPAPAAGHQAPGHQRMAEVTGPAAAPEAQMSSADMLRMYSLAALAARHWLPRDQ
jgi:hypothetical protein